jgi:hypothetical protein
MLKFVNAIMLFFLLSGCNPESSLTDGKWLVVSVTAENSIFKTGVVIQLTPDKLICTGQEKGISYPMIRSNNRLLVNYENNKWLFGLDVSGDEMVLTGLYQQTPLMIKLKKRK